MWGVSTLINSARLFRVDKATGLATLGPSISPLIGTDLDISGLAFNAAGELFVLDTRYPNNPGPAIIMKLNPATGATLQSWNTGTLLGNCARMTFSPGGTLFIADGDTSGTNRLYRFDFAAGSMIDIGPTNAAGAPISGWPGSSSAALPHASRHRPPMHRHARRAEPPSPSRRPTPPRSDGRSRTPRPPRGGPSSPMVR